MSQLLHHIKMEGYFIMVNLQNSQAKKLYENLLNYTDKQTAEQITDKIHLVETPTPKKLFEWAESMCTSLIEYFDDETVKQIRMGCACGPSKEKMNEMKKLYVSATDLNDFAGKYNNADLGTLIYIEANVIYFCYPACYCSYVNKIDKPIPKAWCYCTLGYTKNMFTYVLDCEVDVQLIESIKQGDRHCVMRIERKSYANYSS